MSTRVDLCSFQAATNIDRKPPFFLILDPSTRPHERDITSGDSALEARRKALVRTCVPPSLRSPLSGPEIAHFELLYRVGPPLFALGIEVEYESLSFFFS